MLKAEIWIFSTLFSFGIIGGLSYLLISGPRHAPSARQNITAKTQLTASNGSTSLPATITLDDSIAAQLSHSAVALRNDGDRFLASGNYNGAANRYLKVQKINGRFTSDISIRLGLCSELNQKHAAALAHYRRAIDLQPRKNHQYLALTGLARNYMIEGKRSASIRLLCGLFMESSGDESFPTEVAAEVNYQLAQALCSRCLDDYHFDLSQPDGVAFYRIEPEVNAILSILNNGINQEKDKKTDSESSQSTRQQSSGINLLQRPNDSINLMIVDAQSTLQPIDVFMKQLTATCQLELMASPRAQSIMNGRTQSVSVNSLSASILLDSALLPLNLIWHQSGNEIHITTLSETHADDLQIYWQTATERFYRRFQIVFPGDIRGPSVLLSRANLNYIQGNLDQAETHYQELAGMNPRDEMLARLFFNRGKLLLRLGQNADAIREFYNAVDQSYDAELQSYGYWLAGQLNLEIDQLDEAIRASGRGLSLAQNDQQKRNSAMTMARSYLLKNQPYAANQALFMNRHAFSGSSIEPAAAVLGSYARYIGSTDKIGLKAESIRLLAAVTQMSKHQHEHFIDVFMTARAYQELGFQEQAIEQLTIAADSTNIMAWRRRILFELGVQLKIAARYEPAEKIFQFLIAGEQDRWYPKSLMHMAQIHLEQKKYLETVELCERLWDRELETEDQKAILNTLGLAYRELGKHHSAALCFAGTLPAMSKD